MLTFTKKLMLLLLIPLLAVKESCTGAKSSQLKSTLRENKVTSAENSLPNSNQKPAKVTNKKTNLKKRKNENSIKEATSIPSAIPAQPEPETVLPAYDEELANDQEDKADVNGAYRDQNQEAVTKPSEAPSLWKRVWNKFFAKDKPESNSSGDGLTLSELADKF